ncbi:STAS domain-containing protein [Corallincola luteus]|uniref:STAS domain-containing protein n=1 Tax=Corallincola luteus TaxID=1775177 RepID=A0ABY2AP89_9GAMM|nr:STAS domain-containing protein [Corallincola luteus]TCI03561.1 STAS domain-containing protein [Corallincola luteus]
MSATFERVKASHFQISGKLDRLSVPTLWDKRESLCCGEGITYVDLSGLEHCDSAGMAFLFELFACQSRHGRVLNFVNAPEQLMRLVEVSDLNDILLIEAAKAA